MRVVKKRGHKDEKENEGGKEGRREEVIKRGRTMTGMER